MKNLQENARSDKTMEIDQHLNPVEPTTIGSTQSNANQTESDATVHVDAHHQLPVLQMGLEEVENSNQIPLQHMDIKKKSDERLKLPQSPKLKKIKRRQGRPRTTKRLYRYKFSPKPFSKKK